MKLKDIELDIVLGNITRLKVDIIVNAANSSLMGGGGVDGAIHQAAGPGLLEECKSLRRTKLKEGLKVGDAVITNSYFLYPNVKKIIHTVGPKYYIYGEEDSSKLLKNCYINSLRVAEGHKLKSIAFPAISTGIYGFPFEKSLPIIKEVLNEFNFVNINKVVLCYFSRDEYNLAKKFFKS